MAYLTGVRRLSGGLLPTRQHALIVRPLCRTGPRRPRHSVPNDVRNYTLNLCHHDLVRRLVLDDEVELSPRSGASMTASGTSSRPRPILLKNLVCFLPAAGNPGHDRMW